MESLVEISFEKFFLSIQLFLPFLFQDLDLRGILSECENRGITFDELLTVPEQDEWVYSDGKSTTCVVFILEMYKAAGLFEPMSSSIQVTEFTVSVSHCCYRLIFMKFFSDITEPVFCLCRSAMPTCLKYSRIIVAACQAGVGPKMGNLSARYWESTTWSFLNITPFDHIHV